MLDARLLDRFVHEFYGYGSFDAPIWFVGMEEGGGKEIEQVVGRFSAWQKRGCSELEDLADYHREFGVTKFWRDKPPLQPTWNKLIRVLLGGKLSSDKKLSRDQIRNYQRDHLGRIGGETCLLELLPLPSPNASEWSYGNWSDIPQLADRNSYRDWLIPDRIKRIRKRIKEHQPKVVMFYGVGYRKHWQEIAESLFEKNESNKTYACQSGKTFFFVAPHPSAERGNEYWHELGKHLATKADFPNWAR